MNGLKGRAATHEKGINSKHVNKVIALAPDCDSEQTAIMAAILDNIEAVVPPTLFEQRMSKFVSAVNTSQKLMPGGTFRSRQIMTHMALQVWGLI